VDAPDRVVPVAAPLPGIGPDFLHRFAPYSVTVLQLPSR